MTTPTVNPHDDLDAIREALTGSVLPATEAQVVKLRRHVATLATMPDVLCATVTSMAVLAERAESIHRAVRDVLAAANDAVTLDDFRAVTAARHANELAHVRSIGYGPFTGDFRRTRVAVADAIFLASHGERPVPLGTEHFPAAVRS